VLASERITSARQRPLLTPLHTPPTTSPITVERRGLAAYAQLVDAYAEEVA
jgi:hypothetical protein